MTISHALLKGKLQHIISTLPHSLEAEVSEEALSCGYDIATFFADLLQHGCQSGMVSQLIYYSDTHAFYDKHYDEIEELRYEIEESLGHPLQPQGDLKNWYAWLAFEETARKIADEFEIAW